MLTALIVLHVLLLAGWAGAMAYSLLAVQPKVTTYFGDDEDAREAFLAHLAHGNRWRVVVLLAAIAATGAGWVAADPYLWGIHVVRGGLLVVAAAMFWYVSWRHWPQRVFAIGGERAALRLQLRVIASMMSVLAGTVLVLGLVVLAQP